MNEQSFNVKMYRNVSSYQAIKSLLKRNDLVKAQRDELNKLYGLQRQLNPEERAYVIRMYKDKFVKKTTKTVKPVTEVIITCFEDLSIYRNGVN